MSRGGGDPYRRLTYTVEYLVPGDLDGVSLPPPSRILSPNSDPQQLFRPEVPGNLGIIDPDFQVNDVDRLGCFGNRYIPWFWLDSPVAGGAGASLDLVDITDGVPVLQKQIKDLSGLSTFFMDSGLIVPQGSALRLSGFTNPGGTPIKVRFNLIPLQDSKVIEAQYVAVSGGGSGPPAPSNGDSFIQEFGSSAVSGTGASIRYLWPGSSRSASQTQMVQVPIPVDSVLTAFMLKQGRPPGSGTATLTYTVLVNAVATPATLVVSVTDGSVQSISGLTIPVSAGDQIAIQSQRSATHSTVRDVLASIILEPT